MYDRIDRDLIDGCTTGMAQAISRGGDDENWSYAPRAHLRRRTEFLGSQSIGRLPRFLDRIHARASEIAATSTSKAVEVGTVRAFLGTGEHPSIEFLVPGGTRFRVSGKRTDAPEGSPFRSLELHRIDPSDPDSLYPPVVGRVALSHWDHLRMIGQPPLTADDANVMTWEVGSLFDFLDAIRPSLTDTDAMAVGTMYADPLYDRLLAADGGLPGANWRVVAEEMEDMLAKESIRRARPLLDDLERSTRGAGLVWGEAILAWGDRDRLVCSVPGSRSVFVENVDLVRDQSSYVATLGEDEGGQAITTIQTLSRSVLDRLGHLSSFDPDVDGIPGTWTMRYHHGDDVLEMGPGARRASLPDMLIDSVESTHEAVVGFVTGEMEMGRGNEVDRDFSVYAADFDPDADEESTTVPPFGI